MHLVKKKEKTQRKKVGEKGWSPWCGWEDQAKDWEIQEKCTHFPVQPSQVSLVPGLICGCWMSKPGSWLPCLWPASPPITKLLLPFQALCLLHSVLLLAARCLHEGQHSSLLQNAPYNATEGKNIARCYDDIFFFSLPPPWAITFPAL